MRIDRIAWRVLAALVLAAPIGHAQYRKAKVIHLQNIQDVKGDLNVDKDRATLLEAARKVAQNSDSMIGYLNCGKELTHDGRDRILNAAQSARQAAESLRDSAKSLVSALESHTEFKTECEKTLSDLDKAASLVDAFMDSVEQTRQWFDTERERLQEADVQLAMRAVSENSALTDAMAKQAETARTAAAAVVELRSCEESHQKESVKAFDAFKRWSEEKDPEKAEGLSAEVKSAIEESRKAWAKVKDAEKSLDQAVAAQLQAERELRGIEERYTRTSDEIWDATPRLKQFDEWRKNFLKEFK